MSQLVNDYHIGEKELSQKIRTLNPVFTEEILNLMYEFIMTKFLKGLDINENYSSVDLEDDSSSNCND